MTRKEFILRHIAFEKGMISGWLHIKKFCECGIKAHREELTKKRIKELVEMNKHLFT